MGSTFEELFAGNVRAARARANLSQPDVSRRMRRLGFSTWDPSKVSQVERVRRPVAAAELYGLAVSLECSVAELVGANTAPDLTVTFPAGYEVSGVSVRNSALGYRDGSFGWSGDDDYPNIVRPANAVSATAHDKSRYIIEAGPSRLARYAG